MAKFLAIDWDQGQLRVVLANVKHGAVHVLRAIAWSEDRNPNPAEAEALGLRLKERLKSAGIAAAPVLACVGRDRVILKEIRHPPVEARDEPAMVRFQAVKELNDAPSEVIIDYVPAGDTGGERRALALILRRELSQTWLTLCKAAGLKLAGLCPRPFGTIACLPAASDAAAVLSVMERQAEFCIAHGGRLLLARSLPAPLDDADLLGDIRRNLAVHAGQQPLHPVRGLLVTDERLAARLQDKLAIPVRLLDPFAGLRVDAALPDARGSFAGVVGLLRAWASARALPINFVQPREPKPARDGNSLRVAVALAAVLLLVLGATVAAWWHLATRDSELRRLTSERLQLDAQMAGIESDAARIKALTDWSDSSVVWLDELYDLTHRITDHNALRVTQLTAELTGTRDKSAKEKKSDRHVAKMVIRGVSSDRSGAVDNLIAQLVRDGGYKVGASQWSQNQLGLDRLRFNQQFTTPVEIEFRRPELFVRRLPPPRPPERQPVAPAAEEAVIPLDLGGLAAMTKRERNLALVILTILVVFGGAFFAYFFYLEPLRQKEASIALTRTQIAERRQRIAEVQANLPKLERWRYLSLPSDASLAMREYDNYLRELLKQSGFSADAITRIDTKQADTRSSPALPGKKEPIYTVLSFNVVARGQLTNLTQLLERFYRTGLLQRIKTMTVQRPMTTTTSQRPGELDINLTIEALIVSGADSRPYLIPLDRRALAVETVSALRQGPAGLGWLLAAAEPSGPLGPRVLAEPARQYASLGDKNIFYGPPPPPPPPPPKQSTPGMDMTQFTFLTDIVHSEQRAEAFFYDRLNNSRTRLRNSAGFDTFRIRDSNGDTQVQGKIVRMDERDIIFVASDRYYAIHVGQSMKEALAKPLSAEQIKELGLPALKASK